MLPHPRQKTIFTIVLIVLATFTILGNAIGAGQSPGHTFSVASENAAATSPAAERPLSSLSASGDGLGPKHRTSARASTTLGTKRPSKSLFLPAVTYSTGVSYPVAVAVGDLNGDGHPDLVVGYYPVGGSGVSVLLGNGDGTFGQPTTYPTGGSSGFVALADVNADGNLDVMVFNGNSSIGVLLGRGDGTFQSVRSYSDGGEVGSSITVADVNGDGKPDLIVANECPATSCPGTGDSDLAVSVLLGNGDGTFQAPVVYGSGGHLPLSVTAADVNGDGKPDLIVSNLSTSSDCTPPCSGAVGVLLGKGDGTFQAAVSYLSGGIGAYSVAMADANEDGKLDILVANEESTTVAVLLGNGNGTFQPAVTYGAGGYLPTALVVADVNGDGKPDVLVSSGDVVGVLLGNGDGTFQPSEPYSSGGYPLGIAAADVNGDGRPDVIAANFDINGNVGVLLNSALPTPTATALASSLNPSTYGQNVRFTATVTNSIGPVPTGKVSFTWGGIYTIGTATLNGIGVATLNISALNVDTFPLTAVYKGDAHNLGSTSSIVNQLVNQTTSTATLTAAPNPSTVGQSVTFTATITSPTVIPRGPVTFTAGKTVLGTGQLSAGKAKFTTSSLPAGSTVVKVSYTGDSDIKGSSASVRQVVQP